MRRYSKERHVGSGGVAASSKTIHGEYKTHWHEFYELEYVVSGSGIYRIDGREYPISDGMLFFMTPLDFHGVCAKDCHVYNVMFSEELCDMGFLSRLLDGETGLALQIAGQDRVFWEAVLEELTQRQKDTALVSYLLNSLLGKMAVSRPGRQEDVTSVSRGLLYLLHHFRDNPTLAETAAYAGFTPTYFSAVFKKETGETFKHYVDRLRLDYAKKLLLHSELSVMQVCRESGFDDYPNFIRRFQDRFGMSPGQFRKQKNVAP